MNILYYIIYFYLYDHISQQLAFSSFENRRACNIVNVLVTLLKNSVKVVVLIIC